MEERENELTQEEIDIYNIYLKSIANKANRGFRKRENFDKMSLEDKMSLKRLRLFFESNGIKNIKFYIDSVLNYSNSTFLPLSYFNTIKVVTSYKRYTDSIKTLDCDNDYLIKDFLNGIKFIKEFCENNSKKISEYPLVKDESGVPCFLIHLKEHNISFYHIHLLKIDSESIKQYNDFLNLYEDSFNEMYKDTLIKYNNSKKMKEIGSKFQRIIFKKKEL